MKIFGVGLNKMGTTSLDAAGSSLSAESMSFMRHLYSGDYALWELLKYTLLDSRIEMN